MFVDDVRAVLAHVLKLSVVSLAILGLAVPVVLAQEEAEGDDTDTTSETRDTRIDEVVVTGSRLKRDTYSSISPLQIITSQVSREVGLIDAADILQESSASAGQQIDLTFSGFVLDNGPGASTINLRGLGEARNLVLVNGRRLAPGGVEGAPFAPNINFVPASLVQQYDLLLDGASSVYGSDAISGVANIILRKDFDGVEIEGYSRMPDHGGGVDNTLSVVWGKNFDRGFIGVGFEAVDTERVRLKDRPWTAGCDMNYEIDENGEFRTQDQFYSNPNGGYGMEWDECNLGSLAGRVYVPLDVGSIYHTPGFSNGGWGDWSESSYFGFGVDGNGDGQTDLSFRDYDLNGKPAYQNSDLFPESDTQNVMAFGEYTFAGEANITPYFEIMYAEYDFFNDGGAYQLFPNVPADNPFNLCNPNQPNGVDCGLAEDALFSNPNFIVQFQGVYGDYCASLGYPLEECTPALFGYIEGAEGAVYTQPITSVEGDRIDVGIEADQARYVAGVRGDMPWMNRGNFSNWSFDAYATYSKSNGDSHRPGIRGDRLDHSLGWNSSTSTPCENDLGVELASDVAPGCVPVNMFAPSLYPVGVVVGDFATQAERDYLFDSRDFDTEYEQTIISGYATGDIFELPGGDAAFGIGFERRDDEITSLPDEVARDGLFFGFFSDGGAVGEKTTEEIFAEIELPLFAGNPGMRELTVNVSTRWTDDEIYGANWTESFKLGYRPVDSLLIRATAGTAFRAPNLRELYLQAQTGFLNIFDPCFIPEDALAGPSGEYDPALDNRDPIVLQNCLANGVDPTIADNGGFNVFSTEVQAGGSLTLDPEQSDSWSAGFAWDVDFTNAFDLAISSTYYEIDIRSTIIEPSAQFIVNDCYNSLTGASVFCSRIGRDFSDPTFPVLTLLDRGFLNRDNETARGVDVNLAYDDSFTVFDRPIDISVDVTANRQLERSTLFIDDEGNPDFNEFQGEWGYPEWRVNTFVRFDYSDFRLTWETRYTGPVHQDAAGVDDFDEALTGISDTCVGPPDDVLCRDYGDTGHYYLHNVSLYYYGDQWTIGGGVRNVLDKKPPVIDSSEVLAINNTPIGYGYDINGRVFFLNVAVSFAGGG